MQNNISKNNNQQKIYECILLTIILLIALYLRLNKLDYTSLWTDECLTVKLSTKESLLYTIDCVLGTSQQPFYFIIMNLWIKLFGKSEFILRLPSVIFGLASVFMTYAVSNRLFKNSQIALISSFLLAVSVFNIDHSQDARPYTLATLLSLISIYFFIKLLEKGSFWDLLLYVISTTLLVYTHLFIGTFTIIAQVGYLITTLLFREKNGFNLKDWLLTYLIILVLLFPLAFAIFSKIKGLSEIAFWVPKADLIRVFRTFTIYFSGSDTLFVIFVLLIATGLFLSSNKRELYFLFLQLITPVLILYGISKLWKPAFIERYTLFASIPYYILVACGIIEAGKYKRVLKVLLIIPILILSVLSLQNYYKTYAPFTYKTINWKEVKNYIEENVTSNDLVIYDSPFIKDLIFYYYPINKNLNEIGFPWRDISKANYDAISAQLEPALRKSKRVWLLEYHIEDKKKFIQKKLNKSFKFVRDRKYNKGHGFEELNIKLFERYMP